jgi:hypothetical protein
MPRAPKERHGQNEQITVGQTMVGMTLAVTGRVDTIDLGDNEVDHLGVRIGERMSVALGMGLQIGLHGTKKRRGVTTVSDVRSETAVDVTESEKATTLHEMDATGANEVDVKKVGGLVGVKNRDRGEAHPRLVANKLHGLLMGGTPGVDEEQVIGGMIVVIGDERNRERAVEKGASVDQSRSHRPTAIQSGRGVRSHRMAGEKQKSVDVEGASNLEDTHFHFIASFGFVFIIHEED